MLLALPIAAQAQVIYNGLPSSPTYNVPSQAYEATQTSEFGDEISLAGSSSLANVTIGLSDWAVASTYLDGSGNALPAYSSIASSLSTAGFTVPLTVNIYSVNNAGSTPAAGALLGSVTTNTLVAWRPEGVANPANPSDTSGWIAADGNYYHGLYTTASFNFSGQNIVLPNQVIVTLAFNTTNYGANPTGVVAPYDSLNFALGSAAPSVGSEVNPGTVFLNSSSPGQYNEGGANGSGALVQDTGWTGYVPAIEVTTAAVPEPSSWMLGLICAGLLVCLFKRTRAAQV